MKRTEKIKQELINDASFCRLVNGTSSAEETERWEKWINESFENREAARLATLELIGFEFKEPDMPDVDKEWEKLYQKTARPRKLETLSEKSAGLSWQWLARVAAIFLIVGLTGLGLYMMNTGEETRILTEHISEYKTINTGGGENKTVRFSNGSKIVLNRYSSMSYNLDGSGNQTIDVVLDGEAWFDVPKGASENEPVFEVRTPDGVIRNIGTQFLVTVKPGHTRVVLQNGVVEIDQVQAGSGSPEEITKTFHLEKGEMMAFSRTEILQRERVNPTFYSAWATKFMQFDRTSVREFVDYVEQRFEVRGIIAEPAIEDITLDGAIYFRSLTELVRAVSEVLDVPVFLSEERDTVYIGRPN